MTIYKDFDDAIRAAAKQYCINSVDAKNIQKAEDLLQEAIENAKKNGIPDLRIDVFFAAEDLSPFTPAGTFAYEGNFKASEWLRTQGADIMHIIQGAASGKHLKYVNDLIQLAGGNAIIERAFETFLEKGHIGCAEEIRITYKISIKTVMERIRDIKSWSYLEWLIDKKVVSPESARDFFKFTENDFAAINLKSLIPKLLKAYSLEDKQVITNHLKDHNSTEIDQSEKSSKVVDKSNNTAGFSLLSSGVMDADNAQNMQGESKKTNGIKKIFDFFSKNKKKTEAVDDLTPYKKMSAEDDHEIGADSANRSKPKNSLKLFGKSKEKPQELELSLLSNDTDYN